MTIKLFNIKQTNGRTNPYTAATTYKFIVIANQRANKESLDLLFQTLKDKKIIKGYTQLHWEVKAHEITIRGGIGYNVWFNFMTRAAAQASKLGIKLEGDL